MKRHLLFFILSFSIASAQTYTTGFSTNENPLSESGKWDNPFAGSTWKDIAVSAGTVAYGLQSGDGTYDDACSFLLQTAGTTYDSVVGIVLSNNDAGGNYEVEHLHRTRWTTSPESLYAYEVLWRCLNTSSAYMSIVKWRGPYNSCVSFPTNCASFTELGRLDGSGAAVSTNDILASSCNTIGGVVTLKAYVNGTLKLTATDTTTSIAPYLSGYTGIAHWKHGTASPNSLWGWDSLDVYYTVPEAIVRHFPSIPR